jgi:hypothetical protein
VSKTNSFLNILLKNNYSDFKLLFENFVQNLNLLYFADLYLR